LAAWSELETLAPCSIYQTRAWLVPWIETVGRNCGLEPFFILARDGRGRPIALLPLGLRRRGRLRIAVWLGGTDSNFNMGLLRHDCGWTSSDLKQLMRAATRGKADSPHLYILKNQPYHWSSRANPFAALRHHPSPSPAFGTSLETDAAAFLDTKLSKDTRKKLRKKEARLATLGPIRHVRVTDPALQEEVIETFLRLKTARLRARQIRSGFEAPAMRAFLQRASVPEGGGIELHALFVADRLVAVYGGQSHNGQWSGMFNAIDTDVTIARWSPGDILLARLLTYCCEQGLVRFDLGIGEARYKRTFCEEEIPLFDVILPVTGLGIVAAAIANMFQQTKRFIKARPRLFQLALRTRAILSSPSGQKAR
jgi:CelD/BcsL family acetyltransferase involved in cellulose biosynthesis